MFLSDRDILREIESGKIVCEPFDRANLSNSSIDIRLGRYVAKQFNLDPVKFGINEHGKLTVKDAVKPETYDLLGTTRGEELNNYILYPGNFILAETLEFVGQTSDSIISEVADKSTLTRLGLSVCFSAGYIDTGNALNITLELKNNGNMAIELQYGMHICQIRFAYLNTPTLEKYHGKYTRSTGLEIAK